MNAIEITAGLTELMSMVLESRCQFKMATGEEPGRVFLSLDALLPLRGRDGVTIDITGQTDAEICGMHVLFDATLLGKSCYCRRAAR